MAGIDVHKSILAVVVRQERDGRVEYERRKFGATWAEIAYLAAWLQAQHVCDVVMESTAQYWPPVWYGLEPHFKLHLCHPLKVQARRGRRWDFRDAPGRPVEQRRLGRELLFLVPSNGRGVG